MNIVIFGANGPTGQLLTKQALASGHAVTAFTRHPETFPLGNERLQVMRGDVFDLSSVEQAVAGQDAVLSTLGVPFSRKPITVFSQGIAHIMQAMNHSGVRRLVCVSSSATGTNHDNGGGFILSNGRRAHKRKIYLQDRSGRLHAPATHHRPVSAQDCGGSNVRSAAQHASTPYEGGVQEA